MSKPSPFDYDDSRDANLWGIGTLKAIDCESLGQPVVVVDFKYWGENTFRLSPKLRKIVEAAEDPELALGWRTLFYALLKPKWSPRLDGEAVKGLPLISLLNFFDPVNEIVLRTTDVMRAPESNELRPVPFGEVILGPHAVCRSKEREILVPREDVLRIGRLAAKHLKKGRPFFIAVARHRYIAAVSTASRIVRTVIPYTPEYVEKVRQKAEHMLEFV